MRFPIKSLLLLLTAVAVVVAVVRQGYLHWPQLTKSAAIGIVLWVYFEGTSRTTRSGDLPRNLGATLAAIFIGLGVMLAYRASPSFMALAIGFLAGGLVSLTLRRFGRAILTWSGVESG